MLMVGSSTPHRPIYDEERNSQSGRKRKKSIDQITSLNKLDSLGDELDDVAQLHHGETVQSEHGEEGEHRLSVNLRQSRRNGVGSNQQSFGKVSFNGEASFGGRGLDKMGMRRRSSRFIR